MSQKCINIANVIRYDHSTISWSWACQTQLCQCRIQLLYAISLCNCKSEINGCDRLEIPLVTDTIMSRCKLSISCYPIRENENVSNCQRPSQPLGCPEDIKMVSFQFRGGQLDSRKSRDYKNNATTWCEIESLWSLYSCKVLWLL